MNKSPILCKPKVQYRVLQSPPLVPVLTADIVPKNLYKYEALKML